MLPRPSKFTVVWSVPGKASEASSQGSGMQKCCSPFQASLPLVVSWQRTSCYRLPLTLQALLRCRWNIVSELASSVRSSFTLIAASKRRLEQSRHLSTCSGIAQQCYHGLGMSACRPKAVDALTPMSEGLNGSCADLVVLGMVSISERHVLRRPFMLKVSASEGVCCTCKTGFQIRSKACSP